ncbi:hypothetical protein ACIRNI_28060 [Streptomyces sp. NPDC093546]|uniref:hypothetical protein n=1 Tax=Streptomyces sp. NPDC093546 TaxID=3366040 RepID=UPI0038283200
MLRRISVILAGLTAACFLSATPAAAGGDDYKLGWLDGYKVKAGKVHVGQIHGGYFHLG